MPSTIDVGFRSERGPILISLMVTTGLVAISISILATAVPTIVSDIGGFTQFPWLFSIYLLAQAVSVPIYAKLSDTVGRKPIILFGVSLFLVASVLCGLAWSMPALIAFRALQGLAAGAVLPMAITIAGDIYTVAERAKTQGYMASVWGIAAVAGPTVGGLFAEYLTWRWIFFINIPLCLLSLFLLTRLYHENVERTKQKVDYLGSVLLTLSFGLLIVAVLEGGKSWAWNSWQSIGAFSVGGVLLVCFVLVQRVATNPILPLWVMTRRLLLTAALISMGVGAITIGLSSYVPTYLEGTLGVSPLTAGLSLAALTVGWPMSAAISGRFYLRIGFKPTALIGLSLVLTGAIILAVFSGTPSVLLVASTCFVMGLGTGLFAAPTLIAAQASVGWNERGVVTGASSFARSIGSAVGVAIFGAIANSVYLNAGGETTPEVVGAAGGAVFFGVVGAVILTMIAAIAMPPVRVDPNDVNAVITEPN